MEPLEVEEVVEEVPIVETNADTKCWQCLKTVAVKECVQCDAPNTLETYV